MVSLSLQQRARVSRQELRYLWVLVSLSATEWVQEVLLEGHPSWKYLEEVHTLLLDIKQGLRVSVAGVRAGGAGVCVRAAGCVCVPEGEHSRGADRQGVCVCVCVCLQLSILGVRVARQVCVCVCACTHLQMSIPGVRAGRVGACVCICVCLPAGEHCGVRQAGCVCVCACVCVPAGEHSGGAGGRVCVCVPMCVHGQKLSKEEVNAWKVLTCPGGCGLSFGGKRCN